MKVTGRWPTSKLEHMCHLSTIWAQYILSEDFDVECLTDHESPQNVENCFKILAETFLQTQRRLNLKPHYRAGATMAPKTVRQR